MKNIKKNALKIVVLIALSAPAAFADGDMPGGGLADSGGVPNGDDVVITDTTNDTLVGSNQTSDTSDINSILSAVYEYLSLMI
jgi:hypothetical protein